MCLAVMHAIPPLGPLRREEKRGVWVCHVIISHVTCFARLWPNPMRSIGLWLTDRALKPITLSHAYSSRRGFSVVCERRLTVEPSRRGARTTNSAKVRITPQINRFEYYQTLCVRWTQAMCSGRVAWRGLVRPLVGIGADFGAWVVCQDG